MNNGEARWHSPVDEGSTPAAGRFCSANSGPIGSTAWLLEQLIASPSKQIELLPSGIARAEHLGSLVVGEGATRQTIDLWTLTGLNSTPQLFWTDQQHRFFSMTAYGYLTWLPDAYAGEFDKMQAFSAAASRKKSMELARTLPRKPATPVAFTHVRLFDADNLQFLEDQTVIVSKQTITGVGPAATTTIPPRAEIIDGRGMTLTPGLWDAHKHVGDDYSGIQSLAFGVTSIRDPGNDDRKSVDRRTRRASGELLFPHMYLSSMIDGKGPFTAQVANVATSEEEAIAHVRRAKANDFAGEDLWILRPALATRDDRRRRTSWACTCTVICRWVCVRWTRSRQATTRSRTSIGWSCRACRGCRQTIEQHPARRGSGPIWQGHGSRQSRLQRTDRHHGRQANLRRSHHGRVRRAARDGAGRDLDGSDSVCRHDANRHRARAPQRRTESPEWIDTRRLPSELAENDPASRATAPSRRTYRCWHRLDRLRARA